MDYSIHHHRSLPPSHVHPPPNPETIGKHRRRHDDYTVRTSPNESSHRSAAERSTDKLISPYFGLTISNGKCPAQWTNFEVEKGTFYKEIGHVYTHHMLAARANMHGFYKVAVRMMMYPVLYMLIWTIPTAIRIYQGTSGHSTPLGINCVDKVRVYSLHEITFISETNDCGLNRPVL